MENKEAESCKNCNAYDVIVESAERETHKLLLQCIQMRIDDLVMLHPEKLNKQFLDGVNFAMDLIKRNYEVFYEDKIIE